MMIFVSGVSLGTVSKLGHSTDNAIDDARTKEHNMDFNTTAITKQCYLCHSQTVMNSIKSKNITHLYKGSIASQAYFMKTL